MADNPTKKASAFPLVTASSAADSIPIVRAGVTSRIHPASGGGLDADTVDGYQGATLYIPRGYIDGLICSNAADAEHDITIAAGVARDSTNVMPLILASALTKQIDAAWAAGTNSGGMDTGAVANNSVYYIWLIRKGSDGTIDALFSLSSTAPTMPAGYTYKRRIMSVVTDAAANIIGFRQINDRIIFNTPVLGQSPTALPNTNRQTFTAKAPPSMVAILSMSFTRVASGSHEYAWYGSDNRTNAAASSTNYDIYLYGYHACLEAQILLTSSSGFYIRATSTDFTLGYSTNGWIDDRGRNA